jgi:hypothetical protein
LCRTARDFDSAGASGRIRGSETDDEKRHAELELLKQHNARAVAEEQVAVENAEAKARLIKAHADSEQMKVLAEGQAAQNRAKALELSPLSIQQKAYEALGELGGSGTTIYLGDWSHAPSFLFPRNPFTLPYSLTPPQVTPPR